MIFFLGSSLTASNPFFSRCLEKKGLDVFCFLDALEKTHVEDKVSFIRASTDYYSSLFFSMVYASLGQGKDVIIINNALEVPDLSQNSKRVLIKKDCWIKLQARAKFFLKKERYFKEIKNFSQVQEVILNWEHHEYKV